MADAADSISANGGAKTQCVGARLFRIAGRPVYGRLPRFHQTDQRVVSWFCFLGTLVGLPLLAGYLAR